MTQCGPRDVRLCSEVAAGILTSCMSYLPPNDPGSSSFDIAQQRENEQAIRQRAERYSARHGDEARRPGVFARLLARGRRLRGLARRGQ